MSETGSLKRSFIIIVATVAWIGILLQLWISGQHSAHEGASMLKGVLQALCYFTVLTNILVAIIATRLALGRATKGLLSAPGTLAAVTVYIFVVGLIYSLLLRTLWAPVGLHKLADEILHDVTPILFVVWWVLFAPKRGLRWSQPLKWLLYPLAYFVFAVALGVSTGRYLYPFADIPHLGLATVVRNGALLLVLFWVLGTVTVALARIRGETRSST
jgi:hypothetical protein